MDNNNKQKSILEIVKEIYNKSVKWQIPLTPMNYHILFEYESQNELLRSELDNIFKKEKILSTENTTILFERYCKNSKTDKQIRNLHTNVISTLKDVLKDVFTASDDVNNYQKNLKDFSGEITNVDDISTVTSLIQKMVKDTATMAESNQKFQDKLEDANELAESLKKELEKTQKDAFTDGLTQINNRNAFDTKIDEMFHAFEREKEKFSFIILDIDFFKKFNDKYGHLVGDEVLKVVASALFKNVKGNDFVARYGGEEFIIIFPETSLQNATIISDVIRKKIEHKKNTIMQTGQELDQITISIGVSEVREGDNVDTLIKRADNALYLAKDSGRNNVKNENDVKAAK